MSCVRRIRLSAASVGGTDRTVSEAAPVPYQRCHAWLAEAANDRSSGVQVRETGVLVQASRHVVEETDVMSVS